jgi:hypothetical protein
MPISTHVAPDTPTAEELSGSTNLADYIAEQLAARGEAVLPPGTIDIPGKLAFHTVMGGRIRGGGYATQPTYATSNGFNNPAVTDRYATIIRTSNPSEPVFDLDACQGLTISDLSIETDGVGILYRNTQQGWPTNFCLFDRLAFHRRTSGGDSALAIQAGEPSIDYNAADLEIRSCFFSRVDGLRVKHHQGVNYHFTGTNTFGYSKNAIYLERGGNVVADVLTGYGVETWVRMVGTTGNNRNNLFNFIKSDRTSGMRPPVICDMSQATGGPRAIFNSVGITYHGAIDGTNWPDHKGMLLPANHIAQNIKLVTNNFDTWQFPSGTSLTPQIGTNPFDD